MRLEISFSCVSLRLGFSNFWPRSLGVSDSCLLTNCLNQNYDKQGHPTMESFQMHPKCLKCIILCLESLFS